MSTTILATKLYIPPPRPKVVVRPRLMERLNEGLHRKLTLLSAPAGFGKTTLLSEWAAGCGRPAAWLSLDAGDNDVNRFLAYLVAALQTIEASVGTGVAGVLQSPQPPPVESILTLLLNDITAIPNPFILILDDYHGIDASPVDLALMFLLEHLPPQMHLVIATREDPQLPLSRLRARDQLTELRVTELRFTTAEAAAFLNQVMGLNLTAEDIATLEARTEGWIAGLQLAAISLQGHQDVTGLIKTFSGSHRFVLDYLVEEVLQQQPESVQRFLLHTSILDRLCGPLCDAVLGDASASGQATLNHLERANLFLVPLDTGRRWYRYHHLFADLLRQRMHQSITSSTGDPEIHINELHIRASQWYEDNGLELEAFQHAAAGHDIERAERLSEGKGIPLHFRGAVMTILDWLGSLPLTVLNARPSLWWRYASLLLVNGQMAGVEEKLDAAEAAMKETKADNRTRNLIGRIAAARAVLALPRYQPDTMIEQSRRALEYLDPGNRSTRANAYWTLGLACAFQRDFVLAHQAFTESIALSQASGDMFTYLLATIGLGNVQEAENRLYLAAETYRRVLHLTGDQPLQIIYEAHLGLARILYEWNNLDDAEKHGRQSLYLARQYDRLIDRYVICEMFLARLNLAQGHVENALAMLAQTSQSVQQNNFVYRMPEVAAVRVLALLRQGNLTAAAHLAQTHDIPLSQARVHLASGDVSTALTLLEQLRQQIEEKNWQDERLRVMVLQALAYQAQGARDSAMQVLGEALALAEASGFIRLFVDEGPPMVQLLSELAVQGIMPDYTTKLLAAFETEAQKHTDNASRTAVQPLIEPLSQRELEILRLIAQGLSNQEISEQLFLALSTVKGHNQKIFEKLHVQRRTEAIARARELGLL